MATSRCAGPSCTITAPVVSARCALPQQQQQQLKSPCLFIYESTVVAPHHAAPMGAQPCLHAMMVHVSRSVYSMLVSKPCHSSRTCSPAGVLRRKLIVSVSQAGQSGLCLPCTVSAVEEMPQFTGPQAPNAKLLGATQRSI